MSLRLQIVIGIVAVFALLFILNMVRKKKIDLKHALSWVFFAVIVLILDIFPQILFGIAELMGVTVPSNMIFLVGFILLIVIIYSLSVVVSKLAAQAKRLTQEIALLREEIERMKR